MTGMPAIQDLDDEDFDPFLAEDVVFGDIADLHTPLARLRHEAPVHRSGFSDLFSVARIPPKAGMREFTVLTHALVSEVFSNAELFSNEAFSDNLAQIFGHTISAMDPPEHPRYRRIFQRAFLPQYVAQWGEKIVDPVVHGLMAKFIDRGEADLIEEFTKNYPFQVIYRQLALPEGDGPIFHRLAVAQNLMTYDRVHAEEASRKLGQYFTALIAERRENPGEDLASALIGVTMDGESLPEDVVMSFLRQLINAAGDTTFRGTSVFLTALLENPDQLDALRKDRTLMPQAIEEALRWESPVSMSLRQATRDTVLGGVQIEAGSRINPVIASANRDETVFSDPDRFDIFRDRSARNIAFAVGPHICLGQHLARLEITRAVNAILDRLPNLRLDISKPPPIIRGTMLRYPRHLYVCFDSE